jgi:AraC family transcriptional regulator
MAPFSTTSTAARWARYDDPADASTITELMQKTLRAAETKSFGDQDSDRSEGEPDRDKDRRRPPPRGAQLPVWGVKKLERFIDDNLERSLRLETMAVVVRLSCSHFARACRNTFGITPRQLVLRRRLERALVLMRRHVPLSQVAAACGFADQAHFSRLFRQAVGTSPGQWRRDNLPPHRELKRSS